MQRRFPRAWLARSVYRLIFDEDKRVAAPAQYRHFY